MASTPSPTGPLTPTTRYPLISGSGAIPIFGLGVCASTACTASAVSALAHGYAHLDTAQIYRNERETGAAIATHLSRSGAAREDIFVCSKLWEDAPFTREGAVAGVKDSLERLGLEYIDLYLLHTPRPGAVARHEAWLGLQDCLEAGLVRAIGVSNWAPRHVEELVAHRDVSVVPAVNQIECHPWQQQREIRAYCAERGIVVVAYSPLAQGGRLGDEVVQRVASRVGRTPAQVVLRWLLQRGLVVIPKSDREVRIVENMGCFGWELGEEDVAAIDALDEGQKGNVGEWDPFAWE